MRKREWLLRAGAVAVQCGVIMGVIGRSPAHADATTPPTKRAAAKRDDVTVTPTPWVGPHSAGAGVLLRF